MRRRKIRLSRGERAFDIFNVIFMIILSLAMIYPFWYILIIAFNDGENARLGGIYFWPRVFTLDNFRFVLNYPGLWRAAWLTVIRAASGSVLTVLVCLMTAYALSKRYLRGRKVIIFYLLIPLFIGGTTVSRFIVMAHLGLINNFLVFIIPGAFSYFTAVILRSFIDNLPDSLQESAMIDGAGHIRIFAQIIMPLMKASIAAFLFFSVVHHWLDVQTNVLYITDRNLWTLQFLMERVLRAGQASVIIDLNSPIAAQIQLQRLIQGQEEFRPPTQQVISMAIMVVVTFPMLVIYPFFQRFFVKGVISGAIKA